MTTTKANKNKKIKSAKKIEVEERLQTNDIQQLVKDLRPEIKALYDFAKSTPEEKLSARLSERIYALAAKYERKGMRIDTGNGNCPASDTALLRPLTIFCRGTSSEG